MDVVTEIMAVMMIHCDGGDVGGCNTYDYVAMVVVIVIVMEIMAVVMMTVIERIMRIMRRRQ